MDTVKARLDAEQIKIQALREKLRQYDQEQDRHILLCNDLYVESDIAFCKKTVKTEVMCKMREDLKEYL